MKISQATESRAEGIMSEVEAAKNPAFISLEKLAETEFGNLENRAFTPGRFSDSGLRSLDEGLGGMFPGNYIILAARPSMGKSALALNIAENVAKKHEEPVLFVSVEMSASLLVGRMITARTGIPVNKLLRGEIRDSQWSLVTNALAQISKIQVYISDRLRACEEIVAQVKLFAAKKKPRLIIVDHLQCVVGTKRENRAHEVTEISGTLKFLAKEIDCPMIACCQLNRGVEGRQERKPTLADLRESGAIEQDADVVAFIYREEYYKPSPENRGLAEIVIGKHRNGPTGSINLRFDSVKTQFLD